MDLGLSTKFALVTGADGDIGRAVAVDLATEGATLLLTGMDADGLAATVDAVAAAGAGHLVAGEVVADLSDAAEIDRLAGVAAGRVDVLVHAAGVTGAKGDPLEIDDAGWDEAWQVDFLPAVRLARAFVPAMAARGWGRVVYVTSENATQPYTDEMPYNVAKAALASWTKGLAQAYGGKGVLVNAVAPAFIETGMTDQMMEAKADEEGLSVDEAIEEFLAEERPNLVLERRGRPAEVSAVIAMLCSERASFTVGANYRVDGGSVLAVDL